MTTEPNKSLLKKTPHLSSNKMIWGVVAGLAEYFDVDVTVLRLVVAVGTVLTGVFPGVVLYVVAYWIMKQADDKPTIV